MNVLVRLGRAFLDVAALGCLCRIVSSAVQDRDRRIQMSFKVLGLVKGKLIIEQARPPKRG
jgi:hypothetical protein